MATENINVARQIVLIEQDLKSQAATKKADVDQLALKIADMKLTNENLQTEIKATQDSIARIEHKYKELELVLQPALKLFQRFQSTVKLPLCGANGCKECNPMNFEVSGFRCLMCNHSYGIKGGSYVKIVAACGCKGVGDVCCRPQFSGPSSDVYNSCSKCKMDNSTEKCWKCRP
jgi:hypothetical protein